MAYFGTDFQRFTFKPALDWLAWVPVTHLTCSLASYYLTHIKATQHPYTTNLLKVNTLPPHT